MSNIDLVRLERVLSEDFLLFFNEEFDSNVSIYHDLASDVTPTPWKSYLEGDELNLIQQYQEGDDMVDVIDKYGVHIAAILLSSIVRIHNDEYKRHCVVLLHDLLLKYPVSLKHFNSLKEVTAEGVPPFPFEPIITVLKRRSEDIFILNKLTGILTILLLELDCTDEEDVKKVFAWMTETMSKTENDYIKVVILSNLQVILKRPDFRVIFGTKRRLVKRLYRCTDVTDHTNEQVLYQALNCLWILTFTPEVRATIVNPHLVRNLCKFATSQNQKIVRVTVALMRNIVNEGENGEVMIGNKFGNTIAMLQSKKIQMDDVDIEEDLKQLVIDLEPIRHKMGSFDRFKHEILSGNLEWTSPSHKSERFWRENIIRFDENDYEVIYKLKDIIEHGEDVQTVSIACWDLGEFVRYHPRGKKILEDLGCKVQIMKLLNHTDDNVKGEALLALQKLMVTNWEYLSS
eukprot:TRINITY_DN182_c0_g2_i1.p1 TRINITY_DN182_c0_g2~~TRINITY_DN182_c0_g2_i1.p1  ORF type:complete len:459 (+),score=102.68 TRINITY_DN182_c0_g2_i1:492-1868(+)